MNAPIITIPPCKQARRVLRLFVLALAALVLLLPAPLAQAQRATPSAGPTDKQKAQMREKENFERDTDEAYKKTLGRIPESKQKVDPWGSVRDETKK